jgi:hypothetical protein
MSMPFGSSGLALLIVAALAGCGGKQSAATRTPMATLDEVTAPAKLAAELVKLGGGHVHATAAFQVDTALAHPVDGTKPASPATVTTTTDLWLDKHGNYLLVEENDQDGGRVIARVGGDIAVSLRYGKMIRRPAQNAETARYVTEAVGAPWSAWELVRRQVEVEGSQGSYRFRLSPRRAELPAGFPRAEGLRTWRDSTVVKSLDGQATLDPSGRALVGFYCKATYQATRDGVAVEGSVAVAMSVEQLGTAADVVLPSSELLHTRQRTILEEKALLGGISAAAAQAGNKGAP